MAVKYNRGKFIAFSLQMRLRNGRFRFNYETAVGRFQN
jgi:hypothetical protein